MENKCIFFFKRSTERKKECSLISSFLYTTSNHFFEGEKKNDIFTKKNHEPLHVYCNICDKNLELAESKKWKNSVIMCLYERVVVRLTWKAKIRIFPQMLMMKKVHILDLLFSYFSALTKKCVHACLKMQCLICLLHLK